MLMLIPIEICARATACIEVSAPTMRTLERNRIPKVFIRNRQSSTVVRGTKGSGLASQWPKCTTLRSL
jgi:hypothetical protein